MIEIVVNAKNQLAVALTMIDQSAPAAIDPAASTLDATGLASLSRVIAYKLALPTLGAAGTPADRNVVVPLHRNR